LKHWELTSLIELAYKLWAEGPAIEVDAFLWGIFGCTRGFQVLIPALPFPHSSALLELAEGRDEVGDLVLLEPSILCPSHTSSVSGASLSEADSWGSSPSSGTGGLEERNTCFTKTDNSKNSN
jgi:hypothetical protein